MEAEVRVEAMRAIVDGVDDDDPPATDADGAERGLEGVGEQLASVAMPMEVLGAGPGDSRG